MATTADFIEELEDLLEEENSHKMEQSLKAMIHTLKEPIDFELRRDKVRSILDELDEDAHTPNYTRTKLWFLSSMLESLED